MLSSSELKRILIVDDEKAIANTLSAIFSRAGYDTRAVYSAEEALVLLGTGDWLPDSAIIDVCLPGMHGIDLAILIEVNHPQCGITLFSGQPATESLLHNAREQGHSFDILPKPVRPEELLSRVSMHAIHPDDGACA